MNTQTIEPTLSITFTVSLEDYEICSDMLTRQLRKNQTNRTVVTGILFMIVAVAFFAFMVMRQRTDLLPYLLSTALFVTGIYNILYFPLFFPRITKRKNQRDYHKNKYFSEPTTLRFYEDYFVECSPKGDNKVMWQTVGGLVKMTQVYFLRITKYIGIIIPVAHLEDQTKEQFDRYLDDVLKRFNKEVVTIEN